MSSRFLLPLSNDFSQKRALREGFADGLVELGQDNKGVVVITADLASSTGAQAFIERFPDRSVDVGVAEQNLISVAVGMSLAGKIPFVTSFAAFSPAINWAQIRTIVGYDKNNIKIIGSHAGINVGPDGATHQALEDIALMRVVPNMTVIAPADANQTRQATIAAASYNGPVYIRFGRESIPQIFVQKSPFNIGKAQLLLGGDDVVILANGPMVYRSMMAAKELEPKISAAVMNVHTVKPLDEEAILSIARHTKAVVVAEEHQRMGGLGSAIAELLGEKLPTPIEYVGVHDEYGQSGNPKELAKRYRLTAENIIESVKKVLERKNVS